MKRVLSEIGPLHIKPGIAVRSKLTKAEGRVVSVNYDAQWNQHAVTINWDGVISELFVRQCGHIEEA